MYFRNGSSVLSFIKLSARVGRASVTHIRGSDFYRQRAEDMRRQADRALSPHLRETYLRIALDWERMADEAQNKEARSSDDKQNGPGLSGQD